MPQTSTKLVSVLMCKPTYFSVEYQINPWMKPGTVDQKKAMEQWENLKQAYQNAGIKVNVIEQDKNQPDMVFAADQGIVLNSTTNSVLLSSFRYPQRQGETIFYQKWLNQNGYLTHNLPANHYFEGGGEIIPFYKGYLVGQGFRNSADSIEFITKNYQIPFFPLQLINQKYYHLDTCLFVLSDTTAFYYKPAFAEESIKTLQNLFPDLIEISENDVSQFAANSVVSGSSVFCNVGCNDFVNQIKQRGFDCIQVDISEFMKSGGGIHCLTFELERAY